jgi:hypothetical protein
MIGGWPDGFPEYAAMETICIPVKQRIEKLTVPVTAMSRNYPIFKHLVPFLQLWRCEEVIWRRCRRIETEIHISGLILRATGWRVEVTAT